MPVDYTTQIKPLEDAGKTDAAIIEEIKWRHARDIMATTSTPGQTDLLHVLAARIKVIYLQPDATWHGALVDYFNAVDGSSPAEQQMLKSGFQLLLTQLQISGRPVYCGSHGPTGQLVSGITSVVAALAEADATNPYTAAAVQAEMDELTGGLIAPTFDQTALDAVRADYVATEAANARRQAALAAYQTTVRGKINAADAAAKAAYQAADYSQAIDHAAAVIAAADAAYNA